MHSSESDTALRRDLDRCVKCGLCLPECPTYRIVADEGESPRGRLALIDGLLSGQLAADAAVERHINGCLVCRRCERVCPSLVPFGHLIDAARSRLPARTQRLSALARHPGAQRVAAALGRSLPTTLTRPFPGLHAVQCGIHALGNSRPPPAPGIHGGTRGPTRGRIGLFSGCTGNALQSDALHAAIRLLRRAGFDVEIGATPTCCGALAMHGGDTALAKQAADRTRAAFDSTLDGVVSIASGCGIHLDGYQPPLDPPHSDVCRFLLEQGGFTKADFEPLPDRVALHVPCSVENVYRGAHWAAALLRMIPAIDLVNIGETGQCCGAAGEHMLREPQRAAALRAPVLDALAASGADVLVTSNIGCALHLGAGMRGQGTAIEVLHPVELLARQLA